MEKILTGMLINISRRLTGAISYKEFAASQIFGERIIMTKNNVANNLVLKGTTTIGVVCIDGVILASDTRVTMGFYVAHKHGKKVYKIDNHLGMTIAGTVADAQKVVDILIANAHLYRINMNRPIPVSSAARIIANLLFSARYLPLSTQVLIGGVDDTGPHVFNLDPYGSLHEEKSVATGSGSPLAFGVLEDQYKEGMSIIVVNHDLNLASLYCESLVLMCGGKVFKQGTPNEILNEKILKDVYLTDVKVMKHPYKDVPHILFKPKEEKNENH